MSEVAPPLRTWRKALYAASAWVIGLGALEVALALGEDLWAPDRDTPVPLTRAEEEHASRVLLGADDQRGLGDTLRFHVRSNALTQPDPELLFRVKPNLAGGPIHDYEGINAQGFRGRTLEAPPDGARSIVLLGDSCGFGWTIHEYEKTIAARMESAYEQLGSELRPRAVFNLSQPGYSSEQARMLFERWGETLAPELVVVYLGWNDLYRSASEDRDTLARLRIANAPGLRNLRATHLFRAIEAGMTRVRGEASPHDPTLANAATDRVRRVAQPRSVENLRSLLSVQKARGAHVVVIPPPYLEWMRRGGMPEYIASLRESLDGDALFLELPAMQTSAPGYEALLDRDGIHPSERGALYIAQRIAQADVLLERVVPALSGGASVDDPKGSGVR